MFQDGAENLLVPEMKIRVARVQTAGVCIAMVNTTYSGSDPTKRRVERLILAKWGGASMSSSGGGGIVAAIEAANARAAQIASAVQPRHLH